MKNLTSLFVLFTLLCFTSCQEVVDIDLNTVAPKLVVEASINWQKGTLGNKQTIRLTTTTDYYNKDIPFVSGATVYITNSANVRYDFAEIPNSGNYVCTNFEPIVNETYVLTIINNGETYTATETMKSVTPITRLEQNNESGFTGQDIELKSYFNDPADQENYYLYYYRYSNNTKPTYYIGEDKFFNGNEFFSISQNEELEKGDLVEITHCGISKNYYNYMSILISISGENSGGPFQAPPVTVRGNLINKTNATNYALGYFSLSETDTRKMTIE